VCAWPAIKLRQSFTPQSMLATMKQPPPSDVPATKERVGYLIGENFDGEGTDWGSRWAGLQSK